MICDNATATLVSLHVRFYSRIPFSVSPFVESCEGRAGGRLNVIDRLDISGHLPHFLSLCISQKKRPRSHTKSDVHYTGMYRSSRDFAITQPRGSVWQAHHHVIFTDTLTLSQKEKRECILVSNKDELHSHLYPSFRLPPTFSLFPSIVLLFSLPCHNRLFASLGLHTPSRPTPIYRQQTIDSPSGSSRPRID